MLGSINIIDNVKNTQNEVYEAMIKSKKILIWGTGNIAKEIIKNNINGEVLGFIETIKSKDFFLGKKYITVQISFLIMII